MIQSRQRNNHQTKLEIYQSHSQCVVERRHHNLPHIQRQKWEFLWCGWYHEEWLCWYGEDPSTRKLKLENISSPRWEGTKQKVIYPLKHFLTKQKTTGHCEISNRKVITSLIQKANTSKQNQIKKPDIHQLWCTWKSITAEFIDLTIYRSFDFVVTKSENQTYTEYFLNTEWSWPLNFHQKS